MATKREFDLSAQQARHLALAAQGFGRPRPSGRVDGRHLRRAIDDVGLLQLDSVNVFLRSHYMPVFSRLGSYPREALDRLAWHEDASGQIKRARRVNFERHYDLPERVLPRQVLEAPTPTQEEAQRQLLLFAAKRLGVATEPDLGDYFRLPRAESKARVAELAEDGALIPVQVEGWDQPAYITKERPAGLRRVAKARALLTPFDSLVWARDRTERLFDFRYRIEIYVPAPKRVHGYYVLPFLLGDRLVARVDLKSDRQAGVLRVQSAFAEPGTDPAHVAKELAEELRLLSEWLSLGGVSVARKGDLAPALRKAVA
ncbi:MAG TPA: crosslink repair DNA glycosylase YcaQ family protein [Solirubrobacterales bacterium]